VLNPYPELNSRNATCLTPIPSSTKGYVPSSTQGTAASRPLRYLRSLTDHAHHSKHNTNLLQQNRLAGDTYHQALPLPDCLAGDTYHQALSALVFTATIIITWRDFLYRQAPRALVFTGLQTPPGAPSLPPSATPVLELYWF